MGDICASPAGRRQSYGVIEVTAVTPTMGLPPTPRGSASAGNPQTPEEPTAQRKRVSVATSKLQRQRPDQSTDVVTHRFSPDLRGHSKYFSRCADNCGMGL